MQAALIENEAKPLDLMKQTARGTGAASDLPDHERVYRELRDRVLHGDLRPGQPVTIQGLVAELDAGMTPVREAIRRMTSDGGLIFQGNRRVSVPVLAQSDVEELVFIRCAIEPELGRRACLRAEKGLLDVLKDTDDVLDAAIANGDVPGYLRSNHQFHELLYAAAQAPILEQTAARLWLRFGPSLRVVCGRFGTSRLPDRHKEILTALRDRDPEATAQALASDITEGMSQVLDVLKEDESMV